METDLKGRVALITGSSRGLGKAIAEALAAEGAEVIINSRTSKEILKTAEEIRAKYNATTYPCQVDATKAAEVDDFFLNDLPAIGRLDILVNNIGNLEKFGRFEELTEEDWQRSFDLTFMSAVRFIKGSLPYLRSSNQPRIINISSLSAHQPSGLNPHYGMAKAGLVNLTKNLAQDFGRRYGITVNTICPSTLAGGGWHQNIKDRAKRDHISREEAERTMYMEESRKSPLGKVGRLKDVADLVVFLSSSNATFLTGHCYNVDGGITRSV